MHTIDNLSPLCIINCCHQQLLIALRVPTGIEDALTAATKHGGKPAQFIFMSNSQLQKTQGMMIMSLNPFLRACLWLLGTSQTMDTGGLVK